MQIYTGSTTTSSDPDVLHGALVVIAAAAGLVWALAHHGSSAGARNQPAPSSPSNASKRSRSASSQPGCL